MKKPKKASLTETLLYAVSCFFLILGANEPTNSSQLPFLATTCFFSAVMLGSLRVNGLPRRKRVRVRAPRQK